MNSQVLSHSKIRKLRARGYTYTEINKKLNLKIPKSSLSYICKDINLTKTQQKRIDNLVKINLKESQKKAVAKNKEIFNTKLKKYYKNNQKIGTLIKNRDSMLIALSMLYLGEGAKWKSQRGLMLGSSSPG